MIIKYLHIILLLNLFCWKNSSPVAFVPQMLMRESVKKWGCQSFPEIIFSIKTKVEGFASNRIFICKSNSGIANVHLSVHLSQEPLNLSNRAYQQSDLLLPLLSLFGLLLFMLFTFQGLFVKRIQVTERKKKLHQTQKSVKRNYIKLIKMMMWKVTLELLEVEFNYNQRIAQIQNF